MGWCVIMAVATRCPRLSRWTKSTPSSKKQCRAVIWTAYSRTQRRVVAYHIGDKGVSSAIERYERTRRVVPDIAALFTDANSRYRLAFQRHGVTTPHAQTKAQTHLIGSTHSSIQDNLARLNRRSQRFSKSWEILAITLDLFLNRHLMPSRGKLCPGTGGPTKLVEGYPLGEVPI